MEKLASLHIRRISGAYRFRLELQFDPNILEPGFLEYTSPVSDTEREQLRSGIEEAAQGSLGAVPLNRLGRLLYQRLLPEEVKRTLWEMETPLSISTDDPEMPWELCYNGEEFLCLKTVLGRRLVTARPIESRIRRSLSPNGILLIGNPRRDLSAAEEEAAELAQFFSDQALFPQLLLNDQAALVPVEVELQEAEMYAVIHYAGHAAYDAQTEQYVLLLANNTQLTSRNIQNLLNGQPVVFLNACGTDRSKAQWEMTDGLAEAFIRGGARAVIGTRWVVGDAAAQAFAHLFYQAALKEELPIGEALQQAQRQFRKERPGDLGWTAFVLYGDPRLHLVTPRGLFLRNKQLNRGRFSPAAQRALEDLVFEARFLGHETIQPLHLFIVLTKIKAGSAQNIFEKLGVDGKQLRDDLRRAIRKEQIDSHTLGLSRLSQSMFSEDVRHMMAVASQAAESDGMEIIEEYHLLVAFLQSANQADLALLKQAGVDAARLESMLAGEEKDGELYGVDGRVNPVRFTAPAWSVLTKTATVAGETGAKFLGAPHFIIALISASPYFQDAIKSIHCNPETVAGQIQAAISRGKVPVSALPLNRQSMSDHLQMVLSTAEQIAMEADLEQIEDRQLAVAYARKPETTSIALLRRAGVPVEKFFAILQGRPIPLPDPSVPVPAHAPVGPAKPPEKQGGGLFTATGQLDLSRFAPNGRQALEIAAVEAQYSGHLIINTAHLFVALCKVEGSATQHGLEAQRFSPVEVRRAIRTHLQHLAPLALPPVLNQKSLAPRVQEILSLALAWAGQGPDGPNLIEERHLLLGFLDVQGSSTANILQVSGVRWPPMYTAAGKASGEERQAEGSLVGPSSKPQPAATPVLDKLGRDLTHAARQGQLEAVLGRREEIQRLIQILTRQRKNNALLIGDAGVGKTAIVEGLAQRVAEGKVPPQLKDRRILEIPIASLTAGTQYRGQFEERLAEMIQEARQIGAILFFDEIHTLVGAGQTSGSMLDAGNILKPALARGDLHCIGATTPDEFARSIEKDAALERRFQPIFISEPTDAETLEILRGLQPKYESYYDVTIQSDALEAAVQLSNEHLIQRHQPDKAIDLLEETCSRASMRRFTTSTTGGEMTPGDITVSPQLVAEVLSQWTGIPAGDFAAGERDRFIDLEARINQIIIGQEKAIRATVQALLLGRAGLRPDDRPLGVLLFVGPSGVGKTALAYALAQGAFGSPDAIFRVDMSEFTESHAVAKLTGAPPGYVGYEQEGLLTGHLRRHPHGVVLFDEIEKAHPSVYDLLLQLFDSGRLVDSQGRQANGQNSIYILTSNLAPAARQRPAMGFVPGTVEERELSQEELRAALTGTFRTEFLNRLDEIVVFRALNTEDACAIVRLKLADVQNRARGRGLEIQFDTDSIALLVKQGFSEEFGARNLQRTIDRMVSQPLSELIVKQQKGHFLCTVEQDHLVFLSGKDIKPSDFLTL